MSYGELTLPPVWTGINKENGRFLKGHVPANKGKKWSEYMGKRAMKRAAKGWKNLDLHRNKNGRADNAGRCRKPVIAVTDDGDFRYFSYLEAAAQWCGGSRENVGRCCRQNHSQRPLNDTHGRPTAKVNTDHKYMGIRFYFESDNVWTTKIQR